MPTEAQKRADRKYKAEKTQQIIVRFYPTERDLIEYMDRQDNKQGYIKSLIRADIGRQREKEREG